MNLAVSTDRSAEVTRFAESAVWTGASVHDPSSWLHARRRMVTASRMAALLGYDSRADVMDVYADMVSSEPPPEFEAAFDSPMYWGSVLEEPIARAAARHYGWELRMGGYLLASRRCQNIGATLDAEIRQPGEARWLPYEGKTVSVFAFRDWDEDSGVPPDRILIQAQTQLLVTGAECDVVFALVGGNKPVRIDVAPIPELHDAMIDAVEELLERVSKLEPPPPTWRSKRALDRLFPGEVPGHAVALPAEAVEWTRELEHLAAQAKQIERAQEVIRNKLRISIQTASVGELPIAVSGKRFWKWTTTAAGARYLRLVKDDETQKAPRRRQARRA